MNETEMLKERCRSLEEALAAAHVETARAELRARDVARELAKVLELNDSRSSDLLDDEPWVAARELLAAAPDSDVRLREVVGRSLRRGYEVASSAGLPNFEALIAEVLEVKP